MSIFMSCWLSLLIVASLLLSLLLLQSLLLLPSLLPAGRAYSSVPDVPTVAGVPYFVYAICWPPSSC